MKKQQMNYINCKDSYPLQLKGRMTAHYKIRQNQNMKNLLNYSSSYQQSKQSRKISKQNVQNQNSLRKALTEKIGDNYNQLDKKYEKCIVPKQNVRNSRKRPESVRTYKQQRHGAGINYLLEANQKAIYKSKEKSHIKQFHVPQREVFGKKMVSASQYDTSKYNYNPSKAEKIKCQSSINRQSQINLTSKTIELKKSIPETTLIRIQNDIYSSFNKFEPEKLAQISKIKFPNQNQFKIGKDLGYETVPEKKLNCQKMSQIMGSTYCKKQQAQKNNFRDDWRRSSIVFQ